MAVLLKSFRCSSKTMAFVTNTFRLRNSVLQPKAPQKTESIPAAFYSCFHNQGNSFQGREDTKLTVSNHIAVVPAHSISTSTSLEKYYVKPNYLKKWGRRDMKRREMFRDYEIERSGLRMIKKSDILPSGVREKAAKELSKLPLNSSLNRVRNRCVLTDRARGIVGRFRVSRMMFRYFAEKGQVSGVQKAQW